MGVGGLGGVAVFFRVGIRSNVWDFAQGSNSFRIETPSSTCLRPVCPFFGFFNLPPGGV